MSHFDFTFFQESELQNLEKKVTRDDQDFGEDTGSANSESSYSGGTFLVESPEPSIRLLSPRPSALPREYSNMKYSQLNKIILSMSSADVNEEEDDDTDSEPRTVSGLTGESVKNSNEDDPLDEMDVQISSRDGNDEDTNENTDAFPDLNLTKKG